MKKILLPLAAVVLLALAAPAFAEIELGISWTQSTDTNVQMVGQTQVSDTILGFHVAYGWFILYGAWDSLALPGYMIEALTSYVDPLTGEPIAGFRVPGFLNLYDVGIRLVLQPLVVSATIGTNSLYLYGGKRFDKMGANFRLGAGLKFGWWGLSISGTSVFGSMDDLTAVLAGLGSTEKRSWALEQLTGGLVPSLDLTFYF